MKHYFTDTVKPHWWQAAKCGKGPAVGNSPSDARLGFCTDCLPVEPEDLEDVDGSMADGFALPYLPVDEACRSARD